MSPAFQYFSVCYVWPLNLSPSPRQLSWPLHRLSPFLRELGEQVSTEYCPVFPLTKGDGDRLSLGVVLIHIGALNQNLIIESLSLVSEYQNLVVE